MPAQRDFLKDDSIKTVVQTFMVQTMEEVGERMGIKVKTIARDGDPYTSAAGVHSIVPKGYTYVKIILPPNILSTKKFWEEVHRDS